MTIAALITCLITAAGGLYLLGIWLACGGVRQQQTRATRFAAPVIFGHFVFTAAAGLVVWIIYLAIDKTPLTWAAFIIIAARFGARVTYRLTIQSRRYAWRAKHRWHLGNARSHGDLRHYRCADDVTLWPVVAESRARSARAH